MVSVVVVVDSSGVGVGVGTVVVDVSGVGVGVGAVVVDVSGGAVETWLLSTQPDSANAVNTTTAAQPCLACLMSSGLQSLQGGPYYDANSSVVAGGSRLRLGEACASGLGGEPQESPVPVA